MGASGGFGCGGNSEKKLSLQDVAELLRTRACSRVVVMVGAGISTPSGIPDFRYAAVPLDAISPLSSVGRLNLSLLSTDPQGVASTATFSSMTSRTLRPSLN